MVWPFSSSGGDGGGSKIDLDPTLQEFVKAQGPVSYSTAQSQQQSKSQTQSPASQQTRPDHAQVSNGDLSSTTTSSSSSSSSSASTASPPLPDYPVPTLFPDGRYAHLWKTYRPLAAIEDETKTTAEKTADMLIAFRDRDSRVKKAGLENCAAENIALFECNAAPPTAHDRFTLCRDYTRRLERCYVTQVRFLRALGYLTEPGRSPDAEEDIQLHADDLFRRMLAQERMTAEARAAGRPEPLFASVLASEISRAAGASPVPVGSRAADGSIVSPTMDGVEDARDEPALPPEAAGVSDKTKANMRARLMKLNAEERAIERLAMATEIREANKAATLYSVMALKQKAEREERRQAGTASIGDRVSGWLGW